MRFPKGFSAVMAEGAVGTTLSAAFGILCARHWGPEISGAAALAFTLASTFSFVSCFSIEQIVVLRYVGTKTHESLFLATVFIRTTAIGLSLCGMFLAANAVSGLEGEWHWLPYLAFLQMSLAAMDLLRLRAQALNQLHRQVVPRLVLSLAFFAAKTLCLVKLPSATSVWATQGLAVVESALCLAVSAAVTQATAPLRLRPWPAAMDIRGHVRDVVRASAPLFAAALLVLLFFKLDFFVLGELAGPRDLGLYASAIRLMEMYVGIANLALMQLYPTLARRHSGPADEYASGLRTLFRLCYGAAAGIVAFNFLIGETFVLLLLGERYAEVARYSTLFCLLAIPLLSGTVRGFAVSLEGRHSNHLYAALTGFAVAIPVLLALVPGYGFRGALVADLAAYTTSAMLSSWILPGLRGIAAAQWWPFSPAPR